MPKHGPALVEFARDIKLSHTIFAMPFAMLASFLARVDAGVGWTRFAGLLGLIVLCMVLARSFAMGMNRLLDARLDALNPRTAGRAIPAGRLSQNAALAILAGCALLFIGVCALFQVWHDNRWPLLLSLPVLAFVGAYPLLKRYTRWVHLYLGAALGLAPVCAWVAITGHLRLDPVLLGLGVLCWTAGFDIIYACQDEQSDRQTGVFSLPARLGVAGALRIARALHAVAMLLWVALALLSPSLQWFWLAGLLMAGQLLIYQHRLVRPGDLSRVNVAFFTTNGLIAVLLGAVGLLDTLL